MKRSGSDLVKQFKFTNSRFDTASFDEEIFYSIETGANSFTQKVSSLYLKDQNLLTAYLSVIQFSADFVHHRDLLHNDDGFLIDGTGIQVANLEAKGGSLTDLREFVKVAKDNSKNCFDEIANQVKKRSKNRVDTVEGTPVKLSRRAAVEANEKQELEDELGLEKNYQKSYIGLVNIPLDNISVHKELKNLIIPFRVCGIEQSIRERYDPSQSILVVCSEDDSKVPDLQNLSDQKFLVIQKIHTYRAFQELDKKGEFSKLTGHCDRKVMCYVLNTNSSALIHYGNARANQISNKFSRKTYPQDLLHTFEELSEKEGCASSLKVVTRMAKLSRVGPDETTSLKKLCEWSTGAFKSLMEVLRVFEVYETLDVKRCGNAGRISRREKLTMTNALFNKLAKCKDSFFEAESPNILSKEISLKSLVESHQKHDDVTKVFSVLMQISGYRSKDQLTHEYPGKFDIGTLENFIGAEIKGMIFF